MPRRDHLVPRRPFLKAALQASTIFAVPHIIPASALGKDGAVAPSERIVLGGIGIGNRGTYDLGCFLPQPDVQFVAVCDVKAARRDGRQADGRRASTATRTAPPIATSASCWPATTSTPC